MKIKGLVTEVYEGVIGKGKSAGQPFFTISLDDDSKLYLYTKENYQWIEKVEEGKTYEFEVEKFRNYLTITGIAKETEPVVRAGTPSTGGVAPMTERFYKNRISALSATVDYLKDDSTHTKETFEDTFDWFFNLIQPSE